MIDERVAPEHGGGPVHIGSDGRDGVPFGLPNDVEVASDGRIYFSDSSSVWGINESLYDLLEARPNGRLLRYDPKTGQSEVLLDGLYYANGVTLSKDEGFVLVNETFRYRITRYWLTGVRAGSSEVFIDNLPGFPDGIMAFARHINEGKNVLTKKPIYIQREDKSSGLICEIALQYNDGYAENVYSFANNINTKTMFFIGITFKAQS